MREGNGTAAIAYRENDVTTEEKKLFHFLINVAATASNPPTHSELRSTPRISELVAVEKKYSMSNGRRRDDMWNAK